MQLIQINDSKPLTSFINSFAAFATAYIFFRLWSKHFLTVDMGFISQIIFYGFLLLGGHLFFTTLKGLWKVMRQEGIWGLFSAAFFGGIIVIFATGTLYLLGFL